MDLPIRIDRLKSGWILLTHYVGVGIMAYLAYLLYQETQVLLLAAVAVAFLTLLMFVKAVGESLEVVGVLEPTTDMD